MNKKQISTHHLKRLEYLSTFFRELRFAEGMTQYELSQQLNIHRNTIQRAESGKNITLISLFELIDTYEIRPEEVFMDM
jgi:transcriptional regulator with XRE-family HTH domain